MASAANLNDVQPEGFFTQRLAEADPAVAEAIGAELTREQTQIELIASENIVSKAVLEAQGSVLTNKYAEGYPGRRYYQGCAPSDAVETLAIERAKQLFGCGFAIPVAGGDVVRRGIPFVEDVIDPAVDQGVFRLELVFVVDRVVAVHVRHGALPRWVRQAACAALPAKRTGLPSTRRAGTAGPLRVSSSSHG